MYVGGSFATFPARIAVADFPYYIRDGHDEQSAETLRKREKVLQAWVFFGLLHEMLSPFDLFHAREYIDTDADGTRWLRTRQLNQRIQTWFSTIRGVDENRRQSLLTHFEACTSIAAIALYLLSNDNHKSFDRMIRISLLAICDTARGMIQNQLDRSADMLATWMKLGDDILDHETMLHNGWCPSDITAVKYRHSLGISTLWYLQHLKWFRSPDIHRDCTNQSCRTSQSSADLRPRHVEVPCDCSFLGPDMRDIVECLQASDIPVLEVRGERLGDLSIVVHRFSTLDKAETSYVAISHVWAHGLENPVDSTLPRCQVQRLNDLLLAMKRHRFYINDLPYAHRKRVML